MTSIEIAGGSVASTIRFVLDGRIVDVANVSPTTSVLAFLRERLRRTGTKEGCAEGDCGACTVVVAELDGDEVRTRTVNACLQFVPVLDGKALFTVESLKAADGTLHPVQQAMVECHGSQCGFCTPGFVMSLFETYVRHEAQESRPTERELRTAITGNLCRCTGYRPILDAGRRMFELPRVPLDRLQLREALQRIRRDSPLAYAFDGATFHAPRTLQQLVALRASAPAATIVAGNTDVGLWVNKQLRDIGDIVYTGEVAELKQIAETDDDFRIGAAVPLEDAYARIAAHYPELTEIWERFASPPIRNAGTLGGNVANGSPIGDSMPALIALEASVILRSVRGARRLALEDLYIGYQRKAMAADEIVEALLVPKRRPNLRYRVYKISKRYDSDISAVCAAFAIWLDDARIERCRIAFGGMAAIPKRAFNAEATLDGQLWSEKTARAAAAALARDFQPLSDLRASAEYRLQVAQNLVTRFHLETRLVDPMPASAVTVFAAA
jgi:xanthine dehydrogenase small subunit